MNAWVEIDKSALKWNLGRFRNLIGQDRLLMAVVKANAYGHGAAEVAKIACRAGANWLGVFSIDEGLALRNAGLETPILVLGPPQIQQIEEAFAGDLRLTVPSLEIASEIAALAPQGAKVHLKVRLMIADPFQAQGIRGAVCGILLPGMASRKDPGTNYQHADLLFSFHQE